MAFHVKDNFGIGPVSQVPTTWFNSVAKFLNNIVGGLGIKVLRDNDPPTIQLDPESARRALGIPTICPNEVVQSSGSGDSAADVASRAPAEVDIYKDDESDAEKIARIGSSALAARADHVHRLPPNVLVVPDGFDFSEMFSVVASGTRISVTMKPLAIDEDTGLLGWGSPLSFSCVGQVSS